VTATPIGVLGAGSWGTALAVHWAKTGHPVRLWARSEEVCAAIRAGENERYLPGVQVPASVQASHDLAPMADCDPLVMVVPSHGYRGVLRELLALLPEDRSRTVVSGTKGIEVDSLERMSEVTAEEAERAGHELRFAVLSGPSFAIELVADSPTAVVIAAQREELATELRSRLATRTLRLYSSRDVVGVEIGGTAKNVVAIAAGAVEGLGLGHNTLAALITRGLHEITRLGVACCSPAPPASRATSRPVSSSREGAPSTRSAGTPGWSPRAFATRSRSPASPSGGGSRCRSRRRWSRCSTTPSPRARRSRS